VAGLLTIVLAGGRFAAATGQNQMSYKKAHPDAKGVSCKTCHEGAMGKATDLNAYGQALQKFKGAGEAGKLTAEDYQAFDAADNDSDGATNRAELDGGTNPDDATSKP
jgi:hypothetical protein